MKTLSVLKICLIILSVSGYCSAFAVSNIILDGTTGTTTVIATAPSGAGTQYTLNGLTNGTVNGANVFFSFNQFNISAGDTALFQCTNCFTNPPFPLVNVIARVTGPSASVIEGTLNSTVRTNAVAATFSSFTAADFWIFNPNGIVIGSGATINLGSSTGANPRTPIFHNGDKANRIIFTDNAEFGLTTSPSDSTLRFVASTVNSNIPTPNLPVSFGFPPQPTIVITTPPVNNQTQIDVVEPEPVAVTVAAPQPEPEPVKIDAVFVQPVTPVTLPITMTELEPCSSNAKSSLMNKGIANYQPKNSMQVSYRLSDNTVNTLSSQIASDAELSTECHENKP